MQTKTPLLTVDSIRDAHSRGKTVWTDDTLKSMELSNCTAALGIAVALGECRMPTDDEIMKNFDLFSSVASCSSGVELDQAQIVVIGTGEHPTVVCGDTAVWFGELDEPTTEGQQLVRALQPEQVWLSHEHRPWRPASPSASSAER